MKYYRPEILISAYACRPDSISEPGVAWRQVEALASFGDMNFTVLTRRKHAAAICLHVQESGIANIKAVGVDLPRWALFWKRGHIAMHIYYSIWQMLGFFAARRWCSSNRIDLAHHLSFMTLRTMFVPFLAIPSIVGPVGGAQVAPAGFEGVCGHRIKEALRSLVIKSYRWSPLWRLMIRRTGCLIVANRDNLHVIPGADRAKCWVRQIGWETSAGDHPQETLRDRSPQQAMLSVFWGGRLIKWKGLEILLRAVALAAERGSSVSLRVSGKGPDREYFLDLVRDLNIEHRVNFLGFLSSEELVREQYSADLVAFTSLHETTGTALMEAMALGKATVVIAHGGPGEIADSSTSLLVDVGRGVDDSIRQMASGFAALAGDEGTLAAMGSAGRKRIETVFSWQEYIEFLREQYRSLLDKRAAHQ
jgi:glycosyltransferase involved in cell wall biosynthesis